MHAKLLQLGVSFFSVVCVFVCVREREREREKERKLASSQAHDALVSLLWQPECFPLESSIFKTYYVVHRRYTCVWVMM